jgi:prevent-host-death family protein
MNLRRSHRGQSFPLAGNSANESGASVSLDGRAEAWLLCDLFERNEATMSVTPAHESMGIREFKANVSAVLKRVQSGARITLTNHGEPIVDLVPASEKSAEELTMAEAKARLDKLYGVREKGDLGAFRAAQVPYSEVSLVDQLLEDRGER